MEKPKTYFEDYYPCFVKTYIGKEKKTWNDEKKTMALVGFPNRALI